MKEMINELNNKDDFKREVGRFRLTQGYILYLGWGSKKIGLQVLAAIKIVLTSVEY